MIVLRFLREFVFFGRAFFGGDFCFADFVALLVLTALFFGEPLAFTLTVFDFLRWLFVFFLDGMAAV
ncbi:MAG TPA: hypothetical protein VLW06_14935 [Terriglobales bacterium]|nr:hypothetical protein [Terriglobales bacterium]